MIGSAGSAVFPYLTATLPFGGFPDIFAVLDCLLSVCLCKQSRLNETTLLRQQPLLRWLPHPTTATLSLSNLPLACLAFLFPAVPRFPCRNCPGLWFRMQSYIRSLGLPYFPQEPSCLCKQLDSRGPFAPPFPAPRQLVGRPLTRRLDTKKRGKKGKSERRRDLQRACFLQWKDQTRATM